MINFGLYDYKSLGKAKREQETLARDVTRIERQCLNSVPVTTNRGQVWIRVNTQKPQPRERHGHIILSFWLNWSAEQRCEETEDFWQTRVVGFSVLVLSPRVCVCVIACACCILRRFNDTLTSDTFKTKAKPIHFRCNMQNMPHCWPTAQLPSRTICSERPGLGRKLSVAAAHKQGWKLLGLHANTFLFYLWHQTGLVNCGHKLLSTVRWAFNKSLCLHDAASTKPQHSEAPTNYNCFCQKHSQPGTAALTVMWRKGLPRRSQLIISTPERVIYHCATS